LCSDKSTADYFETILGALPAQPRLCANWVLGELAAALNAADLPIEASRVAAPALAGLLTRVADGTISGKIAKDVFAAMWAGEGDADQVIEKRGLKQISDSGALAAAIDEVLGQYPLQLADYRGGNDKLLQFFVGQVMKHTRGQANPQQLNTLLREKLQA
ncbi:MAG: Asp-tRNA(Asn)/Glu-tRNA(Gln) amidotransferase subunit GatB, partial [Rudaea sp.]